MSIKEFEERCYREYYSKNPKKDRFVSVFTLVTVIVSIVFDIVIVGHIYDITQEFWQFIGVLLALIVASLIIVTCIDGLILQKVCMLPYNVIMNAKKDESYLKYPSDYPYSILYPGELYPFDRTDIPPVSESDTVAAPAQPVQVTITCTQCGQQMLIPSTSGSFRIACPKCGNSFVHTN